MNGMDFIRIILTIVVNNSLSLFLWTAVIIFGIILLRRGPAGPVRYLITGGAAKLSSIVLSIAWSTLNVWLSLRNPGHPPAAVWGTTADIIIAIINVTGILFLFYAFWLKMRPGAAPTAHPPELVQ